VSFCIHFISSNQNELRERKIRTPTTTFEGNITTIPTKNLTSSEKKGGFLGVEDNLSVCILLVLYTLQGIPMGLCGSIPLILKEKGVNYESLSLFSLVSLPFSLKMLWAPLVLLTLLSLRTLITIPFSSRKVDGFYSKSFGRRKSWLVPVQIITGLVMVTRYSFSKRYYLLLQLLCYL